MPVVATDPFGNTVTGATSSGSHAAAITPSDTDDLTVVTRAILATADCSVKVTMAGGEQVTLPLQKGYNPLRVSRVWSTGTTLSGASLYALW